jgi:hypothetical protein
MIYFTCNCNVNLALFHISANQNEMNINFHPKIKKSLVLFVKRCAVNKS